MSEIIVDTSDRIARVEIARPAKRNALTTEMYAALAAALAGAEADAAVRAILVHGAPDCFCSGNDLREFLERPPHGDDAPAWRFLRTISTAQKPIVAAVGGPAVGIGTTLLLHCDLVYAAPDTRFQLPFVPLGLSPEAASSLLLPMRAGYQRAAELLLLGRPFGTEQARAAGLVTEVVPATELMARALETARVLAALPAASLRLTKRLMKAPLSEAIAQTMTEELRVFRERLGSPEAQEAMSAFLDKRKADFSRFS